jgi:hypothetical protein
MTLLVRAAACLALLAASGSALAASPAYRVPNVAQGPARSR